MWMIESLDDGAGPSSYLQRDRGVALSVLTETKDVRATVVENRVSKLTTIRPEWSRMLEAETAQKLRL